MSSDSPPDLHMLNVVVRDMAASVDFYRRLGVAVPASGDAAGAHVQLKMPGGFRRSRCGEVSPIWTSFAPALLRPTG